MPDPRMSIVIRRNQIYDPAWEEFVDEELPTLMISDARMDTGTIDGSAIVQRTFGGGTVCRITHLRLSATTAHWFYAKDRTGTLDMMYLPAAGETETLGAPSAPIYAAKGTFKICAYGSYSSGTRMVSYAGVLRFQGTETRA